MSSPDDRLIRRLAELTGSREQAKGPALEARRRLRIGRAENLASRDERRDPLTGHRGVADGLQLLCRAGPFLVELQLRDEPSGVVLRGQLLPVAEKVESPAGALLHVSCGEEAFLACADAAGELVLHGLPARPLDRVVLELEDELVELPWRTGEEP